MRVGQKLFSSGRYKRFCVLLLVPAGTRWWSGGVVGGVSQRNLFNYNRVTKANMRERRRRRRVVLKLSSFRETSSRINATNPPPAASSTRHYNYDHTTAPETFLYAHVVANHTPPVEFIHV